MHKLAQTSADADIFRLLVAAEREEVGHDHDAGSAILHCGRNEVVRTLGAVVRTKEVYVAEEVCGLQAGGDVFWDLRVGVRGVEACHADLLQQPYRLSGRDLVLLGHLRYGAGEHGHLRRLRRLL